MINPLIEELKKALKLDDLTIAAWARTLRNPEEERIHRSSVYKAADRDSPQWLIDEIHSVINKSKREYPEYWKKKNVTGK